MMTTRRAVGNAQGDQALGCLKEARLTGNIRDVIEPMPGDRLVVLGTL